MPVLTRAVWKKVSDFYKFYGISKGKAYELVNREDFPKKKLGPRSIRVDMSRVDEWLEKNAVNF